MLYSLETVLKRIPKNIESYDLIFEIVSCPNILVYENIAREDILNTINEVCNNAEHYEVAKILWDLDLRYYLIIKLRKTDTTEKNIYDT